MVAATRCEVSSLLPSVSTGGPAGANPADTLSWAATLLSNSNISTDIHFLSYHSSDDDDGLDATYGSKYKAFLLNQNRTDIETYVTEWTFRYQDPNNPEVISCVCGVQGDASCILTIKACASQPVLVSLC